MTSVWSVICIQLARSLHGGRWSLPLTTLVEEVTWLTGILRRTGAAVALEGGQCCVSVVLQVCGEAREVF